MGGRKEVYRKNGTFDDLVTLASKLSPNEYEPLLKELVRDGKIVRNVEGLDIIRDKVLDKICLLQRELPSIRWK